MTRYTLGVNNCFAVKRWPLPEAWAKIVRDDLGLDIVQHSFDLVEVPGTPTFRRGDAQEIQAACARFGLTLHSTFTGLAAYSSNLLLHPDDAVRRDSEDWFNTAISFTAAIGGHATGGHIGAFSVSDWRDPKRRSELEQNLIGSLDRIAAQAKTLGLREFYIENLAAAREPSTMDGVTRLLTDGDASHVPIKLCLDVGHQCVPGTTGAERDPYAWLERLGAKSPVVQLQQSDAEGDHHWPFTAAANARGRIEADRVLAALDRSGADEVALILEVIPPFEQDDDAVIDDMVASASYWQAALARHGR